MKFWFLAVAVFAGVLNPFLGGMNATLGKKINQPVWAVATTFAIAFLTTLIVAFSSGQRLPSGTSMSLAPWWSWFGGPVAAGYVLCLTLVASRLGATVFTGITVTVALIVSIVLDNYGVIGYEPHKAGALRIVGGIVMTGGLALILKS